MKLEKVTKSHLLGIAALEAMCFAEPWSERSLAFLTTDASLGVAAMENGEVIAYGGMMISLDEGQITNIAVKKEYRRKGIGKAVLLELLRLGRECGCISFSLEVRASNLPAIELYKNEGFEKAGVRKSFYRAPMEDAWVMVRQEPICERKIEDQ